MLKRFRVSNFRSLANIEFIPTGLNVLIGPNNAGKTNLCAALRFLSLSSRGTLEEAAKVANGGTWNITNVYLKDVPTMEFDIEAAIPFGKETLIFNYLLRVNSERSSMNTNQTLSIEEESLIVSGREFSQIPLIKNKRGEKTLLLHEKRYLEKHSDEVYVDTYSLPQESMLSRLYNLDTNPRANLFKSWLQSWEYYILSPEALRSPEVVSDKEVLKHDGANFGKVLHTLHNENPRWERKLIEELKELEPKLDLFTFQSPDPSVVFLFLEDTDKNRFNARSISDGTLRFLAISYLTLASAFMRDSSLPPPLLIIEEPENGLYVRVLKPLLEQIDPSGTAGQFIFTTHSPYLIDLFDGNLGGVHIVKPGRPSSILVRPDPGRIQTFLEEMPLGELHFREMLG